MFVDSHCHLDRIDQNKVGTDLAGLVENARKNHVEHMLCVCVTLDEYPKMRDTVLAYDNVSISCGVHPLYVNEESHNADEMAATLTELANEPKVVAIGETGLDYFYDPDSKTKQQNNFEQHIAVAGELNKPLIIHTREAREDTLAMLKQGHADKPGGVLHCFTESYEMAKEAIDALDFYISISGIASFRNASELRDTVKALPLDKLLIETDSPWLAPVPHRGKVNQPAYVTEVAKCVADVKGITLEEVARVTTENFYKLFKAS